MRNTGSLAYGGTLIPYTAIERPGRKTFSIVLDYEEGVQVLSPAGVDNQEIETLLRQKAPWILKQQQAHDALTKTYRRRFISGESYAYLGRYYQLRLYRGFSGDSSAYLRQGRFHITLPQDLAPTEHAFWVRDKLQGWYQKKAREHIPAMAECWGRQLGVQPAAILIRDQRKRWGSCDNSGKLRFNWRLIMAPAALIEYVITHELCHLRHPNHSEAFWRTLRAVMPDYENRRERLKYEGPKFHL